MNRFTLLAFAAFGAVSSAWLTYLLVKNFLRARTSAEIYLRGTLVKRAKSPALFWFTVGFYSVVTVIMVACVGVAIFAFIVFSLGV